MLKSIKTRDKLYRKYILHKTNETKTEYNSFKYILHKLIKLAKSNYFRQQIELNSGNPKKLWSLTKEAANIHKSNESYSKNILINNVNFENQKEIADKFNEYFTEVAYNLAKVIPVHNTNTIDSMERLVKYNPNSLYIPPITQDNIVEIINQLKQSNAQGMDGISTIIMKKICPYVSDILTHLLNKAKFPRALKQTKIVPIHKKGNRKCMSNYRPIEITSVVSKIYKIYLKQY